MCYIGKGRLYVCAVPLKKSTAHFCISVARKYLRLTQWWVAGRLWRRRRRRRTLAPELILFIPVEIALPFLLRVLSQKFTSSRAAFFFFLLDLSLLSLLEVKMHWRISLAIIGTGVFLLFSVSIAPLVLVGYHSLFITFGPGPGSSWGGEEGAGTVSCLQSQCLR